MLFWLYCDAEIVRYKYNSNNSLTMSKLKFDVLLTSKPYIGNF